MKTGGNRSADAKFFGAPRPAAGFTVIETMIVLTVSSILAASVILLISGRQNETQFQVAANGMKQQLEQIINETANGYYPSNNDFSCSASPGNPISITAGSSGQGTNSGCIFLGKAVAFGVGTHTNQSFIAYPLVGKHYDNAGNEVSSFSQASPVALAPSSSPSDHSTAYVTQNGLSLSFARYQRVGGSYTEERSYAVLALADRLGDYQLNGDNQLDSSIQKLDLYDFDQTGSGWPTGRTAAPATSTDVTANITSGIDPTPVTSAQLCYASGSTNQSVLLTIAGQGQLAVTINIFENTLCGLPS